MNLDQSLLRAVLSLSGHPCLRVERGGLVEKLSAQEAILLAERGRYVFATRGGRVRWMRRATVTAMWHSCYRTTESPALQPSIEWVTSRTYRQAA